MSVFKIKEEYKSIQIGFNNSAAPLGQRTDLHLLHRIAKHNRPDYLKFFESDPPVAKIQAEHAEIFDKKQAEKKQSRKND